MKLVIADAHEGLKPAVRRVLHATSQRRRVQFMRNALAHAGKGHRRLVSAVGRVRPTGTAFAETDAEGARRQWRNVADQLRPSVELTRFRGEADHVAHLQGVGSSPRLR